MHFSLILHPRAGGFWVLGCSDPLFSTVRSVLPASSSSAKDLAARHGFHFRVTVVFSSVLCTPQKNTSYTAGILPAADSKSPNTPYTLYTPYLFLVFAEYTLILLPILHRKHRFVCVSGTVSLNPKNFVENCTATLRYRTLISHR